MSRSGPTRPTSALSGSASGSTSSLPPRLPTGFTRPPQPTRDHSSSNSPSFYLSQVEVCTRPRLRSKHHIGPSERGSELSGAGSARPRLSRWGERSKAKLSRVVERAKNTFPIRSSSIVSPDVGKVEAGVGSLALAPRRAIAPASATPLMDLPNTPPLIPPQSSYSMVDPLMCFVTRPSGSGSWPSRPQGYELDLATPPSSPESLSALSTPPRLRPLHPTVVEMVLKCPGTAEELFVSAPSTPETLYHSACTTPLPSRPGSPEPQVRGPFERLPYELQINVVKQLEMIFYEEWLASRDEEREPAGEHEAARKGLRQLVRIGEVSRPCHCNTMFRPTH